MIVGSILLAFGIDSWWTNRQERQLDVALLAQLESELARAEEQLTAEIKQTEGEILRRGHSSMSDPISGTRRMPRFMRPGCGLLWLLLLGPVWLSCDSGTDPGRGAGTDPSREAKIDFDFPGASLAYAQSLGGDTFRIGLKDDTKATTKLWFSFRVQEAQGRTLTFRLDNAATATNRWEYRQPVVSTDQGQSWTRITDTAFDGTTFSFTFTARSNADWVARSPAYPFARYLALVQELETHPEVAAVTEVGRTLGGQPLHHLEIRSQPGGTLPAVWAVGRQHPGEPGGSYMMEGFLRWAASGDPAAVALRERAEIHTIPFLNPDGVLAGNQRMNLAGLDLNRQWVNPTLSESPAIFWARKAITDYRDGGGETRILVDFHSAPTDRSNFFFYNEELGTTTALHTEIRALLADIQSLNGDFVPLDDNVARPVQGERVRGWGFTALQTHGLTVESSGNDVTYGPHSGEQMTPERLLLLGEAVGRGIQRQLFGG